MWVCAVYINVRITRVHIKRAAIIRKKFIRANTNQVRIFIEVLWVGGGLSIWGKGSEMYCFCSNQVEVRLVVVVPGTRLF